jgi:hypothetical protein
MPAPGIAVIFSFYPQETRSRITPEAPAAFTWTSVTIKVFAMAGSAA